MAERRPPSWIAYALRAALREIDERRSSEKAERRAKLAVVEGGKRGGAAA